MVFCLPFNKLAFSLEMVSGTSGWLFQVAQLLINVASSTGRCNTLQRVDSIMLPRENRSV